MEVTRGFGRPGELRALPAPTKLTKQTAEAFTAVVSGSIVTWFGDTRRPTATPDVPESRPVTHEDPLDRGHETDGYAESPTAKAILTLAFGPRDRRPKPPFADLTPRQQQVVKTLAELDYHQHRAMGFWSPIASWGLPRSQAALQAYCAGLGPADAGPRYPDPWG